MIPKRYTLVLSLAVVGVAMSACIPAGLVDVNKPSDGIVGEGTVKSYAGAVGLYQGAIQRLQRAVSYYAAITGTFTDELNARAQTGLGEVPHDIRSPATDSSPAMRTNFTYLQAARGQTQQALGALALYPDSAPPAYVARLYAMRGITEVMMAELFCSGIPLTSAPYGKDFEYSAGVSTSDVFARAIAHFDSALAIEAAITPADVPVLTLARVGKGRAWLNLGEYDSAAVAVRDVPTTARYIAEYVAGVDGIQNDMGVTGRTTVTSQEGINGLEWNTNDPRVLIGPDGEQAKYGLGTSIVVADGIEARLIEAEAALHAHDIPTWTGILNTLRASAIAPSVPALSADSTIAATDSLRVDVMFHERAFWLFLTGHRQGDLRRLVRNYGRFQGNVYPTGVYAPVNAFYPAYGDLVTVAPPVAERLNPLYHGCINRNP
jgi:hypothetical protein